MPATFIYTEEELIQMGNEIREVVVHDLYLHNYITSDDRNHYLSRRVFIGYRPSMFGKIWNILNKKKTVKDEDGNQFILMPITMFEEEDEKPDNALNKKKVFKLVKPEPHKER